MKNTIRSLIAASVIGVLALVGCGSSSTSTTGPSTTQGHAADGHDHHDQPAVIETTEKPSNSEFKGEAVKPKIAAPSLDLRSQDGKLVQMKDLRGKVVMVSFLYTHCPDICPVIVQKLNSAKKQMGSQAKDTAIVIVSVDPKGDTPQAVKTYLAARGMTKNVTWLLGTPAQLHPVWKNWGVLADQDPSNPDLVEHNGLVWLVDPQGRRAVYYTLSEIQTDSIVHDAKHLLATAD